MTRRHFLGAAAATGAGAALGAAGPFGGVAYAEGQGNGLTVRQVKIEYADDPLGIGAARPRFGWLMESGVRSQIQTAYRILVASSEERIRSNTGDLWDSGMVKSSDSAGVQYGGARLESRGNYYGKVKVWDRDGRPSQWSEPFRWEMGLLDPDNWQAAWVGVPPAGPIGGVYPAPLLRKDFTVARPVKKARAYVSGLGYYVLSLNGRKVGDRVLDPGYTEYLKRVQYTLLDVTEYLRQGQNVVGAELGTGYYKWYGRYGPNRHPKLIMQLEMEYADGTVERVVTDGTWKVTEGPRTYNSLREGETYDARLEKPGWDTPEYDAGAWRQVSVAAAPGGILVAQQMDPTKVLDTLTPVRITEPRDGVYVFDLGVMTAGWSRLSVRGAAGTKIVLQHAEKLLEDGTVNPKDRPDRPDGRRWMRDEYVLKGDGLEVWEPSFTYKGFQYVQVEGLTSPPSEKTLECRVIHTNVRSTGDFECSDELYNKIHRAMRSTILNNLQSIPTDTPSIEKTGWTGDAHLAAPSMIYNFDMASFFDKWLYDNRDMQLETGQLSRVAPNDDYAVAPEWTAAYPLLTWMLYWNYGDLQVLKEHYGALKRYAAWEIDRRLANGLSSTSLGDWLAPGYGNGATPGYPPENPQLTATAYVYRTVRTMADMARVLGEDEDASRYDDVSAEIKASFNNAFLNRDLGHYETSQDPEYRQTSNAIPLAFGLVPEDYQQSVVESLVRDIRQRGGHLNTGSLGTSVLLPVLTEHGYADVAHTVASQRTYPSWGFWIENGATTMWEAWSLDARSRDHAFLGTIDEWFYKYVAGIRVAAPGCQQVVIKPQALGTLTTASARVETVRGPVSSTWKRNSRDGFVLQVEIPVNATAEVYVPTDDIRSVVATPRTATKLLRQEHGYAVFAAGSGRYTFVSRPRRRGM